MNTYRFGMALASILTGLMCFIGVSVRFGLIGTICVLMTVKLPTYGQLSTYMPVSYTHLPSPRDRTRSRMPSSA